MAATITDISIRGYKSIERLDRLPLRSLNVLVGANGAGKSNFLGLVDLLSSVAKKRLQRTVQIQGGADALLHLGAGYTGEVSAAVTFGRNSYRLDLEPTDDNRLVFHREEVDYGDVHTALPDSAYDGNLSESFLDLQYTLFRTPSDNVAIGEICQSLQGLVAFHFHDTGRTAGMRRWGAINDDERLRPDASNLAAFLHRIRATHPDHLKQVRDVVRLAAPFFDDFKLRPIPTNPDQIQLEWTQAGTDYPFRASQLSDGTLRFICLATALLQPDPPAVMMFDEPELGLHPYALTLLAALFRQAAAGPSQVIVSTQSATLLNEFDAEDVIVVERANGASTFRRLDPAALTEWLNDYAVGDLWQTNVFGGRPKPESGGRP